MVLRLPSMIAAEKQRKIPGKCGKALDKREKTLIMKKLSPREKDEMREWWNW